MGALSWWANTTKTRFDRFLSFAIVGQVGLHLIYGTELFLYGPHIAPLLLLVVARGLGDLKRPTLRFALVTLSVFIPLLALHNITRYTEARALYMERYEAGKKETVRTSGADSASRMRLRPEMFLPIDQPYEPENEQPHDKEYRADFTVYQPPQSAKNLSNRTESGIENAQSILS